MKHFRLAHSGSLVNEVKMAKMGEMNPAFVNEDKTDYIEIDTHEVSLNDLSYKQLMA